jgi:ferritin-like metal-binding protein YciE
MALNSMRDLMLEEIRELYDAEKQASRAYPKLMKAVSSERFKQAIEEHNEETKGQLERLERIFEELELRPRGTSCEALRGLVADAQDLIEQELDPELLDVALIAAAQKLEQFEIAAYGSARAHAEALGLEQAAKLLDETLEEEKAMDQRLNQLALDEVNPAALAAEQEGEEEEEEGDEEEEEEEGEEETTRSERATAGAKPGSSRRRRKS